ncbi:hypothetical protein CRE_12491 [Caenorhabditis remanei]|uniref:Uncharacterized protein n=1 Tax=Caenorhabditis remanei TaxID=31234 RepID=E3M770_CAERE|nr:hypothetical protein CRE_12491 [Caenorhabditis remanei]
MGDDSSQDNTGTPPSGGVPTAGNPQQPASAIRNKVDVPPGFGRRVSSVEVVKNAMPPTKKASVVIFETPDTPKAESGNGLEDRHRNISTASVGDSEFFFAFKKNDLR